MEPTSKVRATPCLSPAKRSCLAVGLCVAGLAAASLLLSSPSGERGNRGARLALCLLAMEALLIAVSAPFLAAAAIGREPNRRGHYSWALFPVLGFEVASLAIIAAASRSSVPVAALLWCQLLYFGFGWLLAAVTLALVRAGLRVLTAQALATLIGVAMLGQVFVANSLIEGITGPSAKMAAINALLWTNPWLIAGGTILQADPLRSEHLYEWSVVIYYGFRYPAGGIAAGWLRALVVAGTYAAVGGAVHALGALLRRHPRG